MSTTPPHAEYVMPQGYYTLRSFYARTGVSDTRRREAARKGIELKTLNIGKRRMVRGTDGIAFLERLAALDAGQVEGSA